MLGSLVLLVAIAATAKIGSEYLGIGDIPHELLVEKYADGRSRFVRIGRGNVHYKDEGEGEPVVLIHGFGASLQTWDGWVKELSGSYRAIRFDLPPFGLTGPIDDLPMDGNGYVEFLESFVEALGLKEFSLAGNSLGGYVSWMYAARHARKVRKLILVDALAYRHDPPELLRLLGAPVAGALAEHLTPYFLIKRSLHEVYGNPGNVTDSLVKRYQDLIRHPGNRQAMRALLSQLGKRKSDSVRSLRTPTLILWGRRDTWIPPEHAERLARDIENSRLVWFDDLGHVPMEEDPARTVQPVKAFLAQP